MSVRHLTSWAKIQIRENHRLGYELSFMITPEQDALLMHSYYTRGEHNSTAVKILSHAENNRLKLYTMLQECKDYLYELEHNARNY